MSGGSERIVVDGPQRARPHRRPIAVGAAALLCAAVGVTACGVGTTDEVQQISPVELARVTPPTTVVASASSAEIETTEAPAASTPESAAVVASVAPASTTEVVTTTTAPPEPFTAYFVEGSRLVALPVDVPAGSRLRRQLAVLENGLTPAQMAQGVRTALPAGIIDSVHIGVTDVTVNLDNAQFDALEPSDQLLLVAQIVLTLTDEPGFHAVSFESDGQPMRVPRPNNIVLEPGEPVTRADYESMLAGPG